MGSPGRIVTVGFRAGSGARYFLAWLPLSINQGSRDAPVPSVAGAEDLGQSSDSGRRGNRPSWLSQGPQKSHPLPLHAVWRLTPAATEGRRKGLSLGARSPNQLSVVNFRAGILAGFPWVPNAWQHIVGAQ